MNVSYYHKAKIFTLLCITTFLFSSCATVANNEGLPPIEILSMEKEPVLDYEIPEYKPGILVDCVGYEADSQKIALFCGQDLPSTFQIIDKDSGEVVFIGKTEKSWYNEERNEYNSYGNFTEFTQTGTYYIKCDVIGRSYAFEIGTNIYSTMLNHILDHLKKEAQELEVAEIGLSEIEHEEWMEQLLLMMQAYELYPDIHLDKDGNQIPDVLDIATQMIHTLVSLQEISTGTTDGCEYAYAATLAKYSYSYKKFDRDFATEILNLANKAWKFKEKEISQPEKMNEKFRTLAAAELYRATGQYQYHAIITQYGEQGTLNKNRQDTLAEVIYLSTKQNVNVNLCKGFMKDLMEDVEERVLESSNSPYYLQIVENQFIMEEAMWDMTLLSIVEYVITNHEYGQIISNKYHYFMGRNSESYCYWYQEELENSSEDSLYLNDSKLWTAGLLLMISEMLTNK